MSDKAPSTLQRDALRAFVRNHAGSKALLAGRKVNNLKTNELWHLVAELGGNPNDVALEPQRKALQQDDSAPAPAPRERLPLQDKTADDQLASIRDLIVNGGFNAADPALRKLIADANKPAEIIEVPTGAALDKTITHAKPTTIDQTWSKLFDVKGPMGKRTTRMWDGAHPETPVKNDDYVWPQPATPIVLSQLARGRNVFLFGPPGTGKTAFAMQFAACAGRPFAIISCDDQTDAPTLLGMTVPSADGGKEWQDGILTKAIQTPGCVICIDEPSVARAGALMMMQNMLEYGFVQIGENGRKVKIAKGVVFIACDNTNGTGGGARHGYIGTGRLNAAFLNRFPTKCFVGYMDKDKEAQVIVAKTGCTKELAQLLISAATTTRTVADQGALQSGIGLRSLFSWAELLTDGIAPRAAFDAAVLNSAPEQDRETLVQQCLLTYDKAAVQRALDPQGAAVDPANANPSDAGREAAEEFTS